MRLQGLLAAALAAAVSSAAATSGTFGVRIELARSAAFTEFRLLTSLEPLLLGGAYAETFVELHDERLILLVVY